MNEKPSKKEYKIGRREFIINTVLAGAITVSAISAIDYFTQNTLAVGFKRF